MWSPSRGAVKWPLAEVHEELVQYQSFRDTQHWVGRLGRPKTT